MTRRLAPSSQRRPRRPFIGGSDAPAGISAARWESIRRAKLPAIGQQSAAQTRQLFAYWLARRDRQEHYPGFRLAHAYGLKLSREARTGAALPEWKLPARGAA